MQNVKATDILLNDTLFCSSHFQYLISKQEQDLTFVSRIKNEYANCKTSKIKQYEKNAGVQIFGFEKVERSNDTLFEIFIFCPKIQL